MSIINSLLDIDFYKLTMAQLAWKHFPQVVVKYAFTNRTKTVPLDKIISLDQIREELAAVRKLTFSDAEITYLTQSQFIPSGMFEKAFLGFLQKLKLPPVTVSILDDELQITVEDVWPQAIFWETIILSIVNELYYRVILSRDDLDLRIIKAEGQDRLEQKVKIIRQYPRLRFVEFGTRRRFSGDWQEEVLTTLLDEVPTNLLGTSNIHLARTFNLRPIGTFAHELFMIFSGIFRASDEELRSSHNKVLQYWWEMYGAALSVALTDTYGSDFFFSDFTAEQAHNWRGFRQDSGDPILFGEKAISFYEQLGIDPTTKLLLPSDGLDIEMIVRLQKHFEGRIGLGYGWGTNLTNDLGLKPLSLVVKAVEANGQGLVKLSDNLAKATGKLKDVERFKQVFGYTGCTFEECRY